MKSSSLLVMEIIWVATAVFCIAGAIRSAFNGGGNKISSLRPDGSRLINICMAKAQTKKKELI